MPRVATVAGLGRRRRLARRRSATDGHESRRGRRPRRGERRDAALLRAPRPAARAGADAERAPPLRRGHGAVPARDQGGAGGRLHPGRDRGVPAGAARRRRRLGGAADPRRGEDRPDRRAHRPPAPDARGACPDRRLRVRLARPLHLRRGVPGPAWPRAAGAARRSLHVTNGESAGNTLRQTALGGAVLPWQDVLHEGPVPLGPRRGAAPDPRGVPLRVRLGEQAVDPGLAGGAGPAAGRGAAGRAAGGAVVRARPVRPAAAPRRARARRTRPACRPS